MKKVYRKLKKIAEDAYIKGMDAPEGVNLWAEMAQIILGIILVPAFWGIVYIAMAIFLL